MIRVKVKKDSVQISGHAGYAPKGSDIVCAGVTALYQGTASYLIDCMKEPLKIESDEKTNTYTILTKDLSESGKLLIGSFIHSLKLIEKEFQDYIKIEQA